MAEIKKALSDLSTKLGVDVNGDTILDYVNGINSSLGVKQGRDITEAIDNYNEDAPTRDIDTIIPATVSVISDSITEVFGTAVSDIQEDVAVTGDVITGTLKYLTEGALPDCWGEGHFICLSFSGFDTGVNSVMAGLSPSMGSGAGDVYEDSDHALVAKVSYPKSQKLKVVTSNGTDFITKYYDLSGLVLEPKSEG